MPVGRGKGRAELGLGWVGFGSESVSHFRSDQGRVRTAAAAVTTDGSAKVDFVIMAGIHFRLIVAEKR